MAKIPFPEGHKPKKQPDKKQQQIIPTQKQPKLPSIQDEGMKFLTGEEINEVLNGDIKLPTEFDKFISENPKSSDELILSHIAWLAKTSAYIAMHLKRWVEENPKKEHVVEVWYRKIRGPFTNRLKETINRSCEDLLDILSVRLPSIQQRFKEQYEQLISIAKNADKEQRYRLGTGINNFKKAASSLHGTVMTIHSEALVLIVQLTSKKLEEIELGTKPDGEGRNTLKVPRGRPIKKDKIDAAKKICNFINPPPENIPYKNRWAFLVDKFSFPYEGKKERRGEALKSYLKRNHLAAYKQIQ